jgi:hypothetical protein
LIGTTSARDIGTHNAKFQLEGVGYNNSTAQIFGNQNNAEGAYLFFGKSRGTSVGSVTAVQSGDNLGIVYFWGADGTSHVPAALIKAEVDGTPGANDMPGRIVLSTTPDGSASPVERMRIDATGRTTLTGSSTTSGAFTFTTKNSASTTTFEVRNDGLINTGTAGTSPYNFTSSNAANLVVVSDGNLLRSTSSLKYKRNVEDLEDQYADAILNCRPVWYQSLSVADNPDWGHWGFIAEEVAEIDPRLCFFGKNEDGSLEPDGVQYDRFVPHLLNLIKRQQQAIETQGAAIAALEAANTDLAARITALEAN